jgi:hypothetical protein
MNLGEGWNLKLQGFSTLYSQVAINNQSRTDMLKKLFCMDLDWQDFYVVWLDRDHKLYL